MPQGYLKFWWRQAEMGWRKTVHFLQARSRVDSNRGGASVAGASRHARMAEGMDARDVAGKCLLPREV
jgi:hypothetical protein